MTEEDKAKYNCTIVPAYCIVDNQKYPDSISEYKYGIKNVITRSPSATDFYNAFNALAETTSEIICFTTSRKVISSYENAIIAAKACNNAKIEVIDSHATAGALHILVVLCRALEESGAGFGDIVRILEGQKTNFVATFSMKTMHPLRAARRIGTVPPECAMPILNQRPICMFAPDGNIVMKKNASGHLNMIRALLEEHKKRTPRKVGVYYSEENMLLKEVMKSVQDSFPNAMIICRRVSHAIRANTGESVICIVSHSM